MTSRAGESIAARFAVLATQEHRLVAAALVRIGIGALVLVQLLRHFAQRHFLWGPDGVFPLWLFEREASALRVPSLFAVRSPLAFDALYVLATLVAAAFLAGWRARWTGVSLYVLVWSLWKRNPLLATGGDTLLLVMLPFVLLMNTGAYLSVDSDGRRIGDPPPRSAPMAALLHDVALGCALLQLCLFYFCAGAYKLLGTSWPDGSAVARVMQIPEFALSPVGAWLARTPSLATAITWATLVFELGFQFLVWSRRTRWIAALQAVVFHVAIAATMGLVAFAGEVLVFQLLLFDDAQYAHLVRRLAGANARAPGTV